jgi:cellulose synthase/poly-beta-1,6-N-acetylglucosamine synthase-like glycosyltransferase
MTDALSLVFWTGAGAALYSYLGFAVLARLLAAGTRTTPSRAIGASELIVPVSIIIPAYNEEAHLAGKIRNTLSTDYPRALLDVIVVSDASTDRTNEIARGFEQDGVRLIQQDVRRGKTAGLNRALAIVRGDILVFTDANASFPSNAIRHLVSYFSDPSVGLVTGYTRYSGAPGGEIEEGTNAYTSLERIIKRAESRWGCCVGADGAIFAMRRSLYRTLRDDDINDFVLPLAVIEQGYRCLLAEDAYCVEKPGENLRSEFRRQSRITNRSLRAIWRDVRLLNPLRFPAFSFFLFSHKVVRLLVSPLLAVATIALAFLAFRGGLFLWIAGAAAMAAAAIALGGLSPSLLSWPGIAGRLLRLATMLATTNLAVLHGWWRFVLGYSEVTWQHDRALRAHE